MDDNHTSFLQSAFIHSLLQYGYHLEDNTYKNIIPLDAFPGPDNKRNYENPDSFSVERKGHFVALFKNLENAVQFDRALEQALQIVEREQQTVFLSLKSGAWCAKLRDELSSDGGRVYYKVDANGDIHPCDRKRPPASINDGYDPSI